MSIVIKNNWLWVHFFDMVSTQYFFGSQNRGFSPTIYSHFDQIEYSVIEDVVFCYPYRMFGNNTIVSNMEFSTKGFRNWKKVSVEYS